MSTHCFVSLQGDEQDIMVATLLQIGIVAMQTRLTIAMDLSCPIAKVTMHHSSDGWPQCQWLMKLVATVER
jgi:hypothetical protein